MTTPPPPQGQSSDLAAGVLWEGEKHSLTSAATGGKMATARYKITAERIIFEAGMLSSSEEFVPMWAVRDMDLKQSMTQKARNLGDVIVRIEHNDYTGSPEVVLSSISDPKAVRNMLLGLSDEARRNRHAELNTQTVNYGAAMQPAPAAQAQAPATPTDAVSMADELKKLAELKELGVLSDDEFAEQKARLLAA